MNRTEVIAKLRAVEPALRAHGVSALYLFGSYARDEAGSDSDLDVFVDPAGESFYKFDNFMGAYEKLQDAFPGTENRLRHAVGTFQLLPPRCRAAGHPHLLMAFTTDPEL